MSGDQHAERPATPGAVLARVREERGLSVEEVADAINLRVTVLRAIERDDFTMCGGDVYARGHIRAYAKQVGIDPAPLLAAYGSPARPGGSRAPGGDQTETARAADDRPSDFPPVKPLNLGAAPAGRRIGRRSPDVPLERTGVNPALVVGAALAVLLVFLAVQVVGDLRSPGRGSDPVAQPSATVPSTPTGTPQPSQSDQSSTPSSSPTSSPAAPTATGVAVAMRFTGDSWVSVRDSNGKELFSGLLGKGDRRRFSDDKSLRLTLGNAGAVRLTVNGKPLGSAGSKGQVVRLKFLPTDPA
jgi:cytoskeletal protein RodZ